MSAAKRIRLEQKAMPVSSEEELNLITLREQNQKLSKNYNHRIKIEQDLRRRIEQLETTLSLCEDKEPEHQLTIVNEDLKQRVEDLEFELNKARLNERRLADDLDLINRDYVDLKKKSLLQANHQDSIRNSTNVNYHNITSEHHNHLNSTNLTSTTPNAGCTTASGSDDVNEGVLGDISESDRKPQLISSHHHDDNLVLNQAKAIQELETRLQDQIELANKRLQELESLNEQHAEALVVIDRLKIEARCIPKETIIETNEYKTLQSHFSVLYNEATQLKTQLVECRAHIIEMKDAHSRQIHKMEQDEMRIQDELRTNIVDLEHSLADARAQLSIFTLQYDKMSQECQATLKLDTELKKHVSNYKIQVTQRNNDLNRLKRLLEESKRAERLHVESMKNSNSHTTISNGDNLTNSQSNHSMNATNTPSKAPNNNNSTNNNSSLTSTTNPINTNNISNHTATTNHTNNHSGLSKKISDHERIHSLQKQIDKMKSEEEALMNDLDVTGQAYEEMQEQNHRLLQQLEEKEDANFKLMTENLKTNAFQKHLKEEKDSLEKLREETLKRMSAQDNVIRSMEEKVHLLQENTSTLEKELEIRNSMNDRYKRELSDLDQKLGEINSEKQKVKSQLEQIQRTFNERSTTLTHESFKNKRLLEELESLKKKYERASKLQSATTPDEVLMEEIREYKEQLTCPSCKTKPKDAVLTKCFHVFCFDCLKTRVDTRQRKCPKCNAQFGANDFHRLYLA